MANWPTYSITVVGNDSAIREIEGILKGQTRSIHFTYIDGSEIGNSKIEVSGQTPWGVHDFDKIIGIAEEYELDLDFHQSDIVGNTEIIGKWEKGKEKEWKVEEYDLFEDYEEDNTPTNNSKSPLVDTDDPLPF